MSVLLGCVADDFTGATDLANTLVRQGMSTIVLLGVPRQGLVLPDSDAIVIALKSRSIPAPDAIRASLAALSWLERAGARQYYFKYCSTFDSTDGGNIGPVAEALLAALGVDFTVACPAFPTNQRTIYQGYLFVGDQLLSESSMRHHPLTPMTDSSLVRVLQRQSKGGVGLIPLQVIGRGPEAVQGAMTALRSDGARFAITDALTDADLITIGAACSDLKLVTGGSGLALGLAENFRRAGMVSSRASGALPSVDGCAAVLSGSCSAATLRQVAEMKRQCDWFEVDPLASVNGQGEDVANKVAAWAARRLSRKPVLVYSTAPPQAVAEAQARLGRERAGTMIEQTMSTIAKKLVDAGVRRMVIAGGETAGAVVTALGVEGLHVGDEIDPGVPWTVSLGERPLALALKSGNFGADDFFLKAFQKLELQMAADGRR